MKALLTVLCLLIALPASASTIELAGVLPVSLGAVQTTTFAEGHLVIASQDIEVDGTLFNAASCNSATSCWWRDALSLNSTAITTQTLTWGAGNSLDAFAFTLNGWGGGGTLRVSVTEANDLVTSYDYAFATFAQSPTLGWSSDIGIRQIVMENIDPTNRSNWSFATVQRSAITGPTEPLQMAGLRLTVLDVATFPEPEPEPEPVPEPATGLLMLSGAWLAWKRRHQ